MAREVKRLKAGCKRVPLLEQVGEDLNNPKTRDRAMHNVGSDLRRHNEYWYLEELEKVFRLVLDGVPQRRILEAIGRGENYVRKIRLISQKIGRQSGMLDLGLTREGRPWVQTGDLWILSLALNDLGVENGADDCKHLGRILGRYYKSVERKIGQLADTQSGLIPDLEVREFVRLKKRQPTVSEKANLTLQRITVTPEGVFWEDLK